jgi:two-component system, OmpR family, response regulator MprA
VVRALIVEDEAAVRDALVRALETEGYELSLATDGAEALAMVSGEQPEVVLLDVMLPVLDGLEVTRRLRAAGNHVPVLMLTARGAVGDRVAGLDAGADDYLVKPFALEELLARLRALVRRTTAGTRMLEVGDLALDPETRDVRRGDRRLELTVTEWNLLELFMRNPRQVLPRSLIYERVWGYDFGPGSHALDVYIGYLRRKLEAGGEPRLIHTARGIGYALRPV